MGISYLIEAMNNDASFMIKTFSFNTTTNSIAQYANIFVFDVCMDYFTNMQFHVGAHSLNLEYLPIHTQCN